MTPDELLRSLLDSRGKAGIDPTDEVSEPTRIRALDALRETEHSVQGLADRIGVTRQTAYRALEPLEEAGLIRSGPAGLTLTCSGEVVRRTYHDICNETDSSGLIQLARSPHKQWVLHALKRTPARKAVLATEATRENGPSRTTIHRTVTEFIAGRYVRERAGACELTRAGQRLLDSYEKFSVVITQALDKRDILRWLPSTLDTLPIEALDGTRVIQNTPDQPHNVLSALTQCIDTDIEIFRWMSTIASPALVAAYLPLFQGSSTDTRVICTEPVLAAFTGEGATVQPLQEFGSYIEKEATRQGATIRFVTDSLSVHLAICDETRVILAPAPTTGVTEATTAGLDSTDSAVVRWATTFFDSKYAEGNPLSALFVERAKGNDTRR